MASGGVRRHRRRDRQAAVRERDGARAERTAPAPRRPTRGSQGALPQSRTAARRSRRASPGPTCSPSPHSPPGGRRRTVLARRGHGQEALRLRLFDDPDPDVRSAASRGMRRATVGSDLIAVVLRLYRQGDAHARARCLDVIDRLTDLNVYGIDNALADQRWTSTWRPARTPRPDGPRRALLQQRHRTQGLHRLDRSAATRARFAVAAGRARTSSWSVR